MIYWGVELGVTSWNKLAVPILQFPQVNFTLLLLSLFSFVAVGFLLKDTFRFSLIENNLENKDLINIVSSRAIVLVAGASLNFLINTIYI
ncbi:MAG: hypothetical protein HON90_07085 [Halobacteriovoraceae bacterium]|nr:hypothetical protein [Halobacteriovoraceae bacterium]